MEVGYLPDMFGHIAQMPQILRLAGFRDAVVWRGVPSQVTKNAFVWEAPDGSSVRAEYLPVGLRQRGRAPRRRQGAHPPDPRQRRRGGRLPDAGDLLCMNGSDHLMPQPWLGRVVAEANDLQDEFDFEVTSLPHYLAGRSTEGLTTRRGRAPLGLRANMLMGVTSNRVDVKRRGARGRAGARAPGRTLGGPVPGARGSTRTGCSSWPGSRWCATPPTTPSAPARSTTWSTPSCIATPRRGDIAAGLANRAVKAFARSLAEPGRDRAEPLAAATLRRRGAGRAGGRPAAGERAGALRAHRDARIDGARRRHRAHGAGDDAGPADQRRRLDPRRAASRTPTRASTSPSRSAPRRSPACRSRRPSRTSTPGSGPGPTPWCGWPWTSRRRARSSPARPRCRGTDGPPSGGTPGPPGRGHARPTAPSCSPTGSCTVDVDAADGTFALDGTAGYGRLVDGGDLGDSYNYSPPRQDSFVDTPGRRHGPGRRAWAGSGPGPHHRHLRLAGPRGRLLAGTGGRAPGRRRHRRGGAGGRRHRAA